jgi:hypothetical protein
MSNFKDLKKKRKSRLGIPPPPTEAGNNLEQPEIAPASLETEVVAVDRRTLRKTGRTVQLATRVTPDFKNKVRQIAARDGLMIVEVLEKAIDIYEEQKEEQKKASS